MYQKSLFSLISLLLCFLVASSQPSPQHALYLELGGNAYSYSINYERQSAKAIVTRVGVSYWYNSFVIPFMIGRVYGTRDHHFEIAGGLDFARNVRKRNNIRIQTDYIAITAFVGYRYQKPEKRFFLKAGFTPIWEVYESNYRVPLAEAPLYPWAGIGFGFRL